MRAFNQGIRHSRMALGGANLRIPKSTSTEYLSYKPERISGFVQHILQGVSLSLQSSDVSTLRRRRRKTYVHAGETTAAAVRMGSDSGSDKRGGYNSPLNNEKNARKGWRLSDDPVKVWWLTKVAVHLYHVQGLLGSMVEPLVPFVLCAAQAGFVSSLSALLSSIGQ